MKFKLSPGYILAFLALLLLLHECHEWLHIIVARIICGCWGIKKFNGWTICDQCNPTPAWHAIILFAGPLANYIVIWTAWRMMKPQRPVYKKSLGFSLFFATLPLARILAAMKGGSDETSGLKLLFRSTGAAHQHLASLAGLSLIVLLSLPALLAALRLMHGRIGRWIVVPCFAVTPLLFANWIMDVGRNRLNAAGNPDIHFFSGTSWLLAIWFSLLIAIVWLGRNKLFHFLRP